MTRPRPPLALEAWIDVGRQALSATLGRGAPWRGHRRYGPVFLVGSGRSGSTLTRRILCAGREIHIPPETYALPAILRTWVRERHRGWNDCVREVLAHLELHPEFDKFDTCLQPLVKGLRETAPEERSLATILDAFYRFHARAQGLDIVRWGDKTPYNTNVLPGIDRVFPDARYVHVLRDGADVVGSYVEAGRYATLDDAAERWRRAVRAAQAFQPRARGRFHEIRYEDLVRTPAAVVEPLCEFLGLQYVDGMLDDRSRVGRMGDVGRMAHHERVKAPIDASSIGRGRRAIAEEHRARLGRRLDADLRRLGYEPMSLSG